MVTHHSHHSVARTVGLSSKCLGQFLESGGRKILKSAEDRQRTRGQGECRTVKACSRQGDEIMLG
jgi:hypothetical protein